MGNANVMIVNATVMPTKAHALCHQMDRLHGFNDPGLDTDWTLEYA